MNKLLQFFDTLALYFNMRHPSEHKEETFTNVPKTNSVDVDITIRPVRANYYSINPFPFREERLQVNCKGRYFEPVIGDDSQKGLGEILNNLTTEQQSFIFIH